MARTVDPERHRERRLAIIDAALTCFALAGFERTTTAAICRAAGIGSGTFFHYFPTKLDLLTAIIDLGTAETRAWFAAQSGRDDALAVVLDYVDHAADEARDDRVAGFVLAVGGVMTVPEVATVLEADERAIHDGLLPWVEAARTAGQIRQDWPTEQSLQWLLLLLNGFLERIAATSAFSAREQSAALRDTTERVLGVRNPQR
jgi:AcrR family transcriptional regulator